MRFASKHLFIFALLWSGTGFSQPVCFQLYGQTTCGEGSIKKLSAAGLVQLKNTTITQQLDVQGELSADHVKLGQTHIHGRATLSNAYLTGQTNILGDLHCDHCRINKTLKLYSNHVELKYSKLAGLTLFDSHDYQQTLTLNHTIVKGDIIFFGHRGHLELCNHAKVFGKIKGLKKISTNCRHT